MPVELFIPVCYRLGQIQTKFSISKDGSLNQGDFL